MRTPTSPTGKLSSKGRRPFGIGAGGFTLLELLAVMALMALLMGLVLPAMHRTYKREQNRSALRQLAVTLRSARSLAATHHQRVRVFLDAKTLRYRLEGSTLGGVLTGMDLVESRLVWQDMEKRHGYVAFYGDGSSSGGYLGLVEPGGRRQVVRVETITGKVILRAGG